MTRPTALIIGAGPAGLTAACELLQRTNIRPVVVEQSQAMGGLSRTVQYRGNRIDLGGHRFFSKSDRVTRWWFDRLPLAGPPGPDPRQVDGVMLERPRRSRIYYQGDFFDYPVRPDLATLAKLGPWRVARMATSYAHAKLAPRTPEKSLEDFFINRFGRELYGTFFQSYTEKVWGRSCAEISAEWGAQRIKGLSVAKALAHALCRRLRRAEKSQKALETSLIERFFYPKHGPGQMWELAANEIRSKGGEILTGLKVVRLDPAGSQIMAAEALDAQTGQRRRIEADYIFSTMPVKHLVRSLGDTVPKRLRALAEGLLYRDFLTVGLLLRRLAVEEPGGGPLRDNWIYIQEPDVRAGRLQIFNNWSPYLVADPAKVWVGMEYFCNEHDDLWIRNDRQLASRARDELASMGLAEPEDVLDATVIRVEKAYPAYFGSYERFGLLRQWLDGFDNLFLIGRNGMHRYNNMDHSMLTAMTAVDNLVACRRDKGNLWDVNAEQEYHEQGRDAQRPAEHDTAAADPEWDKIEAVGSRS